MISKLLKFFRKDSSDPAGLHLPAAEEQLFVLYFKDLRVGELRCKDGVWAFKYAPEFIARADEFYPIVGFPDLHREYRSEALWPFFLIRIPGLGQPAIRETIEREKLDINNEAQLLKRFGHKTLANPFVLVT
jgi:HipA-like protein